MSDRQPKRKRNVHFHFWCTPEESAQIRERMAGLGVTSMGAYMRKVGIDGYIVNLDMTEVREMISLLRRCSANLNQFAKRANETGSVYAADIDDLRVRLDEIFKAANGIIKALAGIK